jgi:hypothetical protein
LIDSDAALVEVDMLHLQASHFGNARPGIEARLADQQVRVFERLVLGVCRNETQASGCGVGLGATPPPSFIAQSTK